MYKLSCTYKVNPGGGFSLKMVDGRCRLFLSCVLGGEHLIGTAIADTEIKLYTGDDATGDIIATVSSTINKGMLSITNFPSVGILFEDGIFAVMNSDTVGVSLFHNGGTSS